MQTAGMKNIQLLAIDPQNDFCKQGGALYVPRAEEGSKRSALWLTKMTKQLSDVRVTMDTHNYVSIFHPIFLIDSKGNRPLPFTLVSYDDVNNGNGVRIILQCKGGWNNTHKHCETTVATPS